MTQFSHLKQYSTLDILKGDNLESEFDNYDTIINSLLSNGQGVADIQALRALVNAANYTGSSPGYPIADKTLVGVASVSDGTNTTRGLYFFISGDATSDTDASVNVDTDGIVAPTTTGMGRWFRIASTGFLHNRGVEALRTLYANLKIDNSSGSDDIVLKLLKRSAGTVSKITADSAIELRNSADNAYQDLNLKAITGTGNISTSGNIATTGSGTITSAGALTVSSGGASVTGNVSATGNVSGVNGTFSGPVSGTTGTFSSTGSFGGAVNMNSHLINNVTDPLSAQDAATKNYVTNSIATAQVFYPNFIDTCTFWFKGQKIIDKYNDSNLHNGKWNDFSLQKYSTSNPQSASFNLSNLTGSTGPLFKTSLLNSKAGLNFDGVNNYASINTATSDMLMSLLRPIHLFIVVRQAAVKDCNLLGTLDTTTNGDMVSFINNAGTQQIRFATGGNNTTVNTGITINTFAYYTIICRAVTGTNGTVTIKANNTTLTTSSSLARAASHELSTLRLGYSASGPTTMIFNGDVVEIFKFSSELSASQEAQVVQYMSTEYGL